MTTYNERYVIDEKGKRVAVLLDIEDYRKILEELEELDPIRAYHSAKASGDEIIPFEEAAKEIEQSGWFVIFVEKKTREYNGFPELAARATTCWW